MVATLQDSIDAVDLKIIDILGKDSSTTFVDIAKQIGVSDATIHIRVRRLREAGIIGNFTISVDNNRLGYDHLAFMGINVEPGFAEDVTNDLSSLHEILEIHEMHNRFDLLLKIRAKDLNELRDIVVNKVRTLPHILETDLMTILKTRKEEQMVPISNEIEIPSWK
ncbi:MAG: Lrp/AsnC family transcriptional regulator [Alphaproteobacteria bacterium]|jgi:Lrp/AsnC family transcriptional regulator, regulator for asnA, asnC and gidA|nr:Lrp/AsnC family transcriptional regulator [Nitrososphaeraceae archaeon]MDW0314390.1 Lrp/AsnC family transcriptional regulator [Nitrososphaeraceae archaeon]RPJ69401.1 MAG: Lrp/AsnC family transcriptional regulator [Alphaproteobacteria bacterium]